MNQFTNNAQDTETSSQNAELRFVELVDQGSGTETDPRTWQKVKEPP
jgi:hypothetical protein